MGPRRLRPQSAAVECSHIKLTSTLSAVSSPHLTIGAIRREVVTGNALNSVCEQRGAGYSRTARDDAGNRGVVGAARISEGIVPRVTTWHGRR